MGALACVRSLQTWVFKCGALVENAAAGSAVTRVMYLHVQARENALVTSSRCLPKTHTANALSASYKVPFSNTSLPKRSEVILNSSRQRIYSVSLHDWAGDKRGKEPRGPCEI